jgi:hypothetical protein
MNVNAWELCHLQAKRDGGGQGGGWDAVHGMALESEASALMSVFILSEQSRERRLVPGSQVSHPYNEGSSETDLLRFFVRT